MSAGEIILVAFPAFCFGIVVAVVAVSLSRSADEDYYALADAERRVVDRQEAMSIIAELHHVLWILAGEGSDPKALHARYMIVETVRSLAVMARNDEWDGDIDVESAFLDLMLEKFNIERLYTNGPLV